MKYTLEITEEAIADLAYLNKSVQVIIFDAIEKQLTYQPSQETRNRKPLRVNSRFEWELRVGSYRIFYNVSEKTTTVNVISVGYKKRNKIYIRDKEVNL